MAKEKKKVPNLRFKGFTDDWEQRKLGEAAEIIGGGTPSTQISNYWNGDINWYTPAEISNFIYTRKSKRKISMEGLENSSARLLPVGTVLFTSRAGIGKTAILSKEGTTNQGFQSIVPNKKLLDSYFIFSLTNELKKYGETHGAGSTFIEISGRELAKAPLKLPALKEQKKIGGLLHQVDELIFLQQRKLELLKQLKKGFLQKMFADKDSKRPVLRFKGFHDDWEQRRLGEVTSHRGGTAIEKYFDENGEYKVISIGSYGLDSKYVDQNIRAKSNEVTNERVVHAGELTMVLNDKTANGTIIGRSLLIENDNEYVINQRTEIIKPEESFNAKFAYTLLNGPFRNKVKRIVQGGTQIYVNYSSVEKLTVPLPNMKEQQKIGSFFNQLDSLIALHQRKQNHLKLLKKSLLQQMFM